MHQNAISAGALPQTPLKSLQHSPDPLAAFKGPTSMGREWVRTEMHGSGGSDRREGRKGECCGLN